MAQTLFDLLGDPEAAAFAPPFAKDLRKKPKNIDVLNAGIAGIGDLAYDVAGFPVDMSTALMRALGAQTGQTPLGSDWLKQKATNIGIRPPEAADPTLRDVRLGAEMMAGGIDPFATARGIGVVGSKVAKELEPTLINALDTYAQKAGLQPSILPKEAAAKVMGQTKIVDESGMPEVYYRGAKSKYDPLSSAGANEASKSGDTGLWLAKSPDLASSYTGSQGLGHVSPAYPDVRNPLVIDAGKSLWSEIPSKAVEDVLGVKLSSPTVTTDQVARIAKERGFDGVQFKNVIDVKGGRMATEASMQPTDVVVAFNPKNVRSALSDKAIAGAARVPPRPKAPVQQAVQAPTIEAPVSPAGFYSATEQAALNLTKTKGTGQSLLDELMKAPNVKKDEMEAIGLLDAFQDKKQVTKQELIDYIGKNKVELGSTVRGDYAVPKVDFKRLDADISTVVKSPDGDTADGAWGFSFKSPDLNETRSYTAYRIPPYKGSRYQRSERVDLYDSNNNLIDNFDSIQDAQRFVDLEAERAAMNDYGPTRPKFQDYAYQGGQNYQETLLTLPNQWEKPRALQEKNSARIKELRDQMYGTSGTDEIRAEISRLQNENQLLQKQINEAPIYTSGHWEQPNVMAHVRTQDFVDADGKKMRLIEEVQSDWHQAGREKGYVDPNKKPYTVEQDANGIYRVKDLSGQTFEPYVDGERFSGFATFEAAENAMKGNMGRLPKASGVPDAPMKDTWYQTALRKAVKEAIDAGQDRVGITTGATQADRYDLSKQISEVNYSGSNFVAYDKNGVPVIEKTGVTENDLPDLIGKEAAKKLLEQPKQGTLRSLSGIDLQVGGEGMKTYYDEIYPKYLDKFAKKYGSSVKEGSINAKGEEWPFPISIESDGKKYWLAGRDPRTDTPNAILSNKFDDIADAYKQRDQMYSGFTEKVRYIEITPEMRKAFGGKDKGVPLFQMAPAIPAGAIGAGGLLDQFGERQQ